MPKDKRSFFERLTGSIGADRYDDGEDVADVQTRHVKPVSQDKKPFKGPGEWVDEAEGQLTLDVYQTPDEIIIQSIIAGVKSEDLDVSITQDMITIRGKRERSQEISQENYYYNELYWGTFSRSVLLPQEVDIDEAEATIKNGLLTVRLPKIDREQIQKLKVRNE